MTWSRFAICSSIVAVVLLIGCSTTRDGITYEKTGSNLEIRRGSIRLAFGTLVETYDSYGRKVWRFTFTTGPRQGTVWDFESFDAAHAFLQELLLSGVFEWDDGSSPTEDEIEGMLELLSDYWVDPDPPINP